MESPKPMDRLVCGDVGFGKTEVAMRAAFKAVQDGRQVMVLCPTTVLALQHQERFAERFAPFPVTVRMLSRFVPAKEQKAMVAEANAGEGGHPRGDAPPPLQGREAARTSGCSWWTRSSASA